MATARTPIPAYASQAARVSLTFASAAPGQDGNAAAGLVHHNLHDRAALFRREAGELSRRAIRVQAVHAALDQPGNKTAQFRLVDPVALIQRDQQRREDTFELGQTTGYTVAPGGAADAAMRH